MQFRVQRSEFRVVSSRAANFAFSHFLIFSISDFSVLRLGIEAGTVPAGAGEVTVAEDGGIRVVDLQGLQEGVQGSFLLDGTRVLGTAQGIETTLIADADGVLVVMLGVGTGEVLMTGLEDLAIAGDIIVEGGEAVAALVAGDEVLNSQGPALAGATAMNNDKIHCSHSFFITSK